MPGTIMFEEDNFDYENINPNSGRQTPISQRRPLQPISFNGALALSPTKRRKQCHVDEPGQLDAAKQTIGARDEISLPAGSLSQGDRQQVGFLLLEVFRRLSAQDLVSSVAPACKLWRDVSQGKELWALLRGNLRLVDQLLVEEKVVERRSKGRLFRCRRLGTGEAVLLRMVDLELTNAGKDDGIPTSFLREAALLSKLKHPNVIRLFGAEILGRKAVICTEFVHESFASWFKRLDTKSTFERMMDIKGKFAQLLTGLSHVHHQGVMHRNLKPDNIFLDLSGVVKLGDFTSTRTLDIPFQAYTPEDPKERDRSGREMRRLWYRAPELILRDEIYGPKVDSWSLGCLLAEAASGRALFQSDSEIDHLFRVFRLLGTPTATSWPEVVGLKNFSPKFPMYSGFSLAQVTRAACLGISSDCSALVEQASGDRSEMLQNLLQVAQTLGPEGMLVVDRLVTLPPSARAGADLCLQMQFFSENGLADRDRAELHPVTQLWLHGRLSSDSPPRRRLSSDASPVPEGLGLEDLLSDSQPKCPPVGVSSSLIPSHMVWNILHVMQKHERTSAPTRADLSAGNGDLPRSLPPGFDAGHRAVMMDFIIGIANNMSLRDNTLHVAACIVDKYLALQDEPFAPGRMQVVGATCLKVADVFAEQSKEYYKQENANDYAEAASGLATPGRFSALQVLLCEKAMLPKMDFDLYMPTSHWFLQCYLAYARFKTVGNVAKTSCFIGDLTLLDYDLLLYPASLRAQCAMLLAVFLVQHANNAKQRRGPTQSASSSSLQQSQDNTTSSSMECSSTCGHATTLSFLEHWDKNVRDAICTGNTAVDSAMCLQAVVRTLVEKRREWKGLKLNAVELRHEGLTRTLVYPERFPVTKLVRYILPDSQRMLTLG